MGRQMGLFGQSRAWRAVMLACGLAWSGPVSGASAESPTASIAASVADVPAKTAEPFGLAATPLAGGGLHDKWQGLQRRLDDDMVQLALCDGDRERCVSPAALKLLDIVDAARLREGRARYGEINRAVNLAIRARSDEAQHGESDVWTAPIATFAAGAGDCEDYAFAKFAALRLAGIPADDLRIVVMRDTIRGEDHAVVAARLDGHWLMLDNRRLAMVEDASVRNFRPTFVMDRDSLRRYEPPPLLADGPIRPPVPAALVSTAALPPRLHRPTNA
jgi:predicted transglutaminase-like cysteine proteinase